MQRLIKILILFFLDLLKLFKVSQYRANKEKKQQQQQVYIKERIFSTPTCLLKQARWNKLPWNVK